MKAKHLDLLRRAINAERVGAITGTDGWLQTTSQNLVDELIEDGYLIRRTMTAGAPGHPITVDGYQLTHGGRLAARVLIAADRSAAVMRAEIERLRSKASLHAKQLAESTSYGDEVAIQRGELRRLIEAHNAGQLAECEGRQQSDGYAGLCAAHMRTSRGRCPDCPRLDMIEAG